MIRTKAFVFLIIVFVLTLSACRGQTTQVRPTLTPMQVPPSGNALAPGTIPQSEAEVPRVSIEEAKVALESGAAVIVDVRSSSAYEESHIAGAVSVPLGEIERNLAGLTLEKAQWIITYCTWLNEHTSARAAYLMLQNGYAKVTPILGGFDAWVDAGYPVEP